MIRREGYFRQVQTALRRNPVVALLGPGQCGKTKLVRQIPPADRASYFDLEDPVVAQLMENPMTALADLRGLVVIDEAQRCPEVFPVRQVLSDRPKIPARFLILGSASPERSRQSAESLAGRVEIVEMRGLDLSEVPVDEAPVLWERGGFPRSYLANRDEDSLAWRTNFI